MDFFQSRKFVLTMILYVFAGTPAAAQTAAELRASVEFEQQATAAYKAKDYAKFLDSVKRASELRPGHARLLYNLAAADALNGKPDEALTILDRLVAMGLFFAVEKDDDFKSLADLPRFKAIQNGFANNQKAVNRSEKAFAIPQKDLLTEGVAYDGRAKRFFVSSVHKRKIVAIDAGGKVSDFSAAADGLWSVSGLAVDEKRRILWATTTAFRHIPGTEKADDGRAGVFKYDLRTGKLLKKYLLSNAGGKHALSEMALTKNGDLFASDGATSTVYRIEAKKDELEVFLTSELFAALQGLAFSPDEKYLFAADYSKGVFRIDMADKKIVQLAIDAKTNPIAIDGLYFYENSLIAIQNGFRPHRVARFYLNRDLTAVTKSETLEANHADFNEPTLGVVVGRDFYFIANSQYELMDRDGQLAEDKLKEPVILRLKL